MTKIKIDTPFITLGQFLKMIDVISSGGMAKAYLSENYCLVDGEKENRRGRKLYPKTIIKVKDFGEYEITD